MSLKFLFNTVNTCLIDSFFFCMCLFIIWTIENFVTRCCTVISAGWMSHLEPGCLIEGGFLQPLCPLSVESLARNGAVSSLHENMTDKQRDRKGIYLLCLSSLQCPTPGNQYPSGMCWDNTAHDGIIPENLERES